MTQRERQILRLIEANPMISQQELADKIGITRSSVAVHISNLTKKGYIAGKGYVLKSGAYVVVVGGLNIDIGGHSKAAIVMEDSNPGKVTINMGGVGRNIAHNLSLMGLDVRFLSACGDDSNGQLALATCAEAGIDVSRVHIASGEVTSTYLYLTGPEGDMVMAVSDMDVCERITPAYLQQNLTVLNNAQVVVMDTNIPEESIRFLTDNCTAPLFCDPVSTAKAVKVQSVLGKINTFKPNRIEAELLTGIPIHNEADAYKAGDALIAKGMHRAFISMGAEGVCAVTKEEHIHLDNIPGNMQNTTGCGDAFMAALVWAYLQGMNLTDTAAAGLGAASIAMESKETINQNMSAPLLRQRAMCLKK